MRLDELAALTAHECDTEVADYILPTALTQHRRQFARDDMVYLTIERVGRACGYFILVLESDGRSVEFRRIVVFERGAGIGQAAIARMENYCRERLGRARVWLDVFDDNARGRHVYAKLGYRHFHRQACGERWLDFYHKELNP